ncbi:DUF6416 domain-containing protein [Micromonospora sp. DT43]|uniref:DUF6416 domain-containing protein n=1 Tax=Micromonospora sp. DT43 TaxID=3393440 RepID=UPI003CF1655E
MLDVTVKVPADRLADFYAMHSRWLAEEVSGGSAAKGGKEGLEPWGPSDAELAKKVWGKFSDSAKALFSILIDSPGREFGGDELAELLDMSGKNAVAGLLGWPGRHCIEARREWLWDWRYPDGLTAVYWLTPEMAELFRSARDAG